MPHKLGSRRHPRPIDLPAKRSAPACAARQNPQTLADLAEDADSPRLGGRVAAVQYVKRGTVGVLAR